jgi:hypothetical protein
MKTLFAEKTIIAELGESQSKILTKYFFLASKGYISIQHGYDTMLQYNRTKKER